MSLEKISNTIKTNLQNTSKSAKQVAQASILATGILAWSGCSEIRETPEEYIYASVEEIPYTKESPFSLIHISNPSREAQCNIFRFQFQDKVYTWSARHCFQDTKWKKLEDDIIILPSFKTNQRIIIKDSQQQLTQAVEIANKYNTPNALNISPLSYQEIENEIVTIQWVFPDVSWDTSYKISGKPIYLPHSDTFSLVLSDADYNKIKSHDSSKYRQWLEGMSGAPVLDSKWQVIGVAIAESNKLIKKLSDNTVGHFWFDLWNPIIFNPIRDRNGEIKNQESPLIEIQSKTSNKKQKQNTIIYHEPDQKTIQTFQNKYSFSPKYYYKEGADTVYVGINMMTWERMKMRLKR